MFINFYYIKWKNEPSETTQLKKLSTEIVQALQNCHTLWIKGQCYWPQLMVSLTYITVTTG